MERTIPATLNRRARDASGALRVHLKAMVASAYLDVISRFTGEGNPCVGIVSNGRSERLSEPMTAFGLFWRFMPFCHSVSNDKRQQLVSVHRSILEAEANSEYPLDRIERVLEGEPFHATLNFVSVHGAAWQRERSAVTLTRSWVFDRAHYPINLHFYVEEAAGSAVVTLYFDGAYVTDAEGAAIIDGFVDAFGVLVESSVVA